VARLGKRGTFFKGLATEIQEKNTSKKYLTIKKRSCIFAARKRGREKRESGVEKADKNKKK